MKIHRMAVCAAALAALIATTGGAARAQSAQASASPAPPPAYKLNRDDEDWSALRRQPATDTFDSLKYIALDPSDPHRYETAGAEVRELYEHYFDQNFSRSAGGNGYLLERYLFSFDTHIDRFRAYTELESALVSYRRGGPGPNSQDVFDPVAAYLAYAAGGKTGDARPPLTLEAGRYELDYGGERILTANNGPGIRHSFDGLRAIVRAGAYRIDAFAVDGVNENAGALDDSTNAGQALIGAYAQREGDARRILDAYVIDEYRARVTYQRGSARENRVTFGSRAGNTWGRLDSELEVAYQGGRFGTIPISAFTVAGTTGYALPGRTASARLYFSGGIGSGDKPGDVMRTFRPPTFKAAYLGALAANGPENSVGIQAGISALFDRRLNAGLEYTYFERESAYDGLYGVAFNLIASGHASQPATIGNGPIVTAGYAFDRHLSLQTMYQRYNRGPFLAASLPGSTPTAYYALILDGKF